MVIALLPCDLRNFLKSVENGTFLNFIWLHIIIEFWSFDFDKGRIKNLFHLFLSRWKLNWISPSSAFKTLLVKTSDGSNFWTEKSPSVAEPLPESNDSERLDENMARFELLTLFSRRRKKTKKTKKRGKDHWNDLI